MSSANIPEKGDVLIIPDPSTVTTGKRVTLDWSQGFSSRSAEYYPIFAHNKTKHNQEVIIFIAAEKFTHEHFNTIAKLEGTNYELPIDGKIQYGQKNATGENRFLVYHDQERKPYQHRFIETSITSQLGALGTHIAGFFGYGSVANVAHILAKNTFGDYLHTF